MWAISSTSSQGCWLSDSRMWCVAAVRYVVPGFPRCFGFPGTNAIRTDASLQALGSGSPSRWSAPSRPEAVCPGPSRSAVPRCRPPEGVGVPRNPPRLDGRLALRFSRQSREAPPSGDRPGRARREHPHLRFNASRRQPWFGPDARVHGFLGRLDRQGCRRVGQPAPQAPTRTRWTGAIAGSSACADTDGSRHGPVHQDPAKDQRAPSRRPDGRRCWPAECVP